MIDVYAPADLFPVGSDRQLAEELTSALLRAEGVTTPAAVHFANTAAYIHRLDPKAVHTAGTDSARAVRVQVLTSWQTVVFRARRPALYGSWIM
jgi:hypothetical protein